MTLSLAMLLNIQQCYQLYQLFFVCYGAIWWVWGATASDMRLVRVNLSVAKESTQGTSFAIKLIQEKDHPSPPDKTMGTCMYKLVPPPCYV